MAAPPVSIKLRCGSWQQLSAIYKRDLVRGAIFLKSAKPPPLGTPVRIDLTLPTDSMIVLNGFIAEHVPEGGLGGRGPGVDVKLATIPQSAMWLIETALASAQKGASGASGASQVGPAPGPTSTSVSQPTPAPRAPTVEPVAVDAGMDEGSDLAEAETELLSALAAEHESLRRLNPFQVLGVGYEASDADVRGAFGELTKRYHPDRFARYASQELRNHAAEIFILIRDAYRRIGDDKGRQQVLAGLGPRKPVGGGPPPPPRAATAPATPPPAATPPAGVPVVPGRTPPVGVPTGVTAVRQPIPAMRTGTPGIPDRAATAPATPPPPPGPPSPPLGPPPPHETERRPVLVQPPPILEDAVAGKVDYGAAEGLLDQGKYDEALAVFKIYAKKNPADRTARAGIELAEGLRALAQRDRLEAAQRFETVLEMDPSNERAARELAEMRRQATNERKGLLSRLLGKKE